MVAAEVAREGNLHREVRRCAVGAAGRGGSGDDGAKAKANVRSIEFLQ